MEKLCSNASGHGNNFDLIRFTLAVMVIFTHSYLIYYGNLDGKAREPLIIFTHGQLTFGTAAVNSFFLISGFLVFKSLLASKSIISFVIKRIRRIYPAFIVVTLFFILVSVPLSYGGPGKPLPDFVHIWSATDFKVVAHAILFLHDVYITEALVDLPAFYVTNASLWTIRYECILYFFLALLGMMRVFRIHKLVPLFLFLAVLCVNIIHHNGFIHWIYTGQMPDFYLPPFLAPHREKYLWFEHFLLYFTSGMCFYAYRDYVPRSKYLLLLSGVVLLVSARWATAFELSFSIFGAYALFYLAFSKTIKLHHFGKYGDLSYGIYLFGCPIQGLAMLYLGKSIGFYGTLFASLAIIIPIAFLSWHLVEKPALSFKTNPPDGLKLGAPSPSV
ncbi:MAG TPA: acyltransferase [Chthoniobacterales bacterium]